MDPVTIGALLQTGANAGGGILNGIMTARQNKKSRQWSEQMYNRQYADNLSFWNMQNAYNSPESQMNRLREAGLNPKLAYGNLGSGSAGPVSTPDTQPVENRVPEFGNAVGSIAPFLSTIYDLEIKQAQVDNLKADNTVKLSQAALNAAGTSRSKFDLQFESDMRQISADARREALRKLQGEAETSLSENERRNAMNASGLAEAAQRIALSRAQTAKTEEERNVAIQQLKNLKADHTLKQLDINLKSVGISPNDPLFMRILGQYFGQVTGTTLDSLFKPE